jgi:two-component system response regulator WspF
MRIAIVNDMKVAVDVIRRAVESDPAFRVVWTAADGHEAVSRTAVDTPDLILMDMVMPGMTGAEATRQIMEASPCPILIVTASIRLNAGLVFEAMGAGALDAVRTPVLTGENQTETTEALLTKIRNVAQVVGKKPVAEYTPPAPAPPIPSGPAPMIGIGTSSGGPAALATIFAQMPRHFPGCFVVVQHLDYNFVRGLVDWLDEQTPLSVRAIRNGDRPEPGVVYLAVTKDHLVWGREGLRYSPEPRGTIHRPSIDVFFQSVARRPPAKATFMVLTGMQSDGAKGLLELKNAGVHTIAQDKASSAVYGMPKAAAKLGAAVEILSIRDIPRALCKRYGVSV